MGPRLVLRGWGGELLRRDNVDKGWGEKRLIRRRCIPRDSLTGIITPVRKKLQESTCRCWLLRPFRAQRDDLRNQLHVVYPGRYYSCGSLPASLTCGE